MMRMLAEVAGRLNEFLERGVFEGERLSFDGHLSETSLRERALQHVFVGKTECSRRARKRWGELEHTPDHTHGNTREGHVFGRPPDGSGESAVWNQQLTQPGECSNE